MLVCPRSCATVSMSPVVASTLLANVRRPEWLEPPLMPARWYSLVTWACKESHAR